jgi:hypothetical protein
VKLRHQGGDLVSQFGFGHDLLDFQSSILIIFLVTYSSLLGVRMHPLSSRHDLCDIGTEGGQVGQTWIDP